MSSHKSTRIAQNRFSTSCPSQGTKFSHSGPLGSLFESLADGQMPNFLEIMAAISEISIEMTADIGLCIDCKRG